MSSISGATLVPCWCHPRVAPGGTLSPCRSDLFDLWGISCQTWLIALEIYTLVFINGARWLLRLAHSRSDRPEHDCLPRPGERGEGPVSLQTGRAYAPRVEFDYMRQEDDTQIMIFNMYNKPDNFSDAAYISSLTEYRQFRPFMMNCFHSHTIFKLHRLHATK